MKTRKTLFTWLLTAFVFSLFSLWGTTLRAQGNDVEYSFTTDPAPVGGSNSYGVQNFTTNGHPWFMSIGQYNSNETWWGCNKSGNISKRAVLNDSTRWQVFNFKTKAISLEMRWDTLNISAIKFEFTTYNGNVADTLYLMESTDEGVSYAKIDSVYFTGDSTVFIHKFATSVSKARYALILNADKDNPRLKPCKAIFTILPPPCELTVSNLSVPDGNLGETGATLSWDATEDATGYKVEYWAEGAGASDTNSQEITETSLALTGLTHSTVYGWRVSAKCASELYGPIALGTNFTTKTPTNPAVTLTPTELTPEAIVSAESLSYSGSFNIKAINLTEDNLVVEIKSATENSLGLVITGNTEGKLSIPQAEVQGENSKDVNLTATKDAAGTYSDTVLVKHGEDVLGRLPVMVTFARPAMPKVVISPNGGTFNEGSPVNVSLSVPAGIPADSIYYTLDGSEPSNTQTKYTAPFNISENTTVKAIAYAKNYNTLADSAVSAEFQFKLVPQGENFFTETFDTIHSGNSSGSMSTNGSVSLDFSKADNAGWSANATCYAAGGCVRFNKGASLFSPAVNVGYNEGVFYITFKAQAWASEVQSFNLVCVSKTHRDTVAVENLPQNGSGGSATNWGDYTFKFTHGTDSTYFIFVAPSDKRIFLDSVNMYQANRLKPASISLALTTPIEAIWTGSAEATITVSAANLTEDATVSLSKVNNEDRDAFTLTAPTGTPATITKETANEATIRVQYAYQNTGGKDSIKVVIVSGSIKDSILIYAESKVCVAPVVSSTDVSDNSIDLILEGKARDYQYAYGTVEAEVNNESTELTDKNNDTHILMEGLTTSTQYFYKVRAVCATGVYSTFTSGNATTGSSTDPSITWVDLTDNKVFNDTVTLKVKVKNFTLGKEENGFVRFSTNTGDTLVVADTFCKMALATGTYKVDARLVGTDSVPISQATATTAQRNIKVQLPACEKIAYTITPSQNATLEGDNANYYDTVIVNMTCATPNSKVYYTLNGGDKTEFTGSIKIGRTSTIVAHAEAERKSNSPDSTFTLNFKVHTPIIAAKNEDVAADSLIVISCLTSDANIYYTLDGSEPTAESTLWNVQELKLTASCTVKAKAFKEGCTAGETASQSYVFLPPVGENTYKKVTDISELLEDSEVIIVSENIEGKYYAATYPNSATIGSGTTYLKHAEVSVTSNRIDVEAATDKSEDKPYKFVVRPHSGNTGYSLYEAVYGYYLAWTTGNSVTLSSTEPETYWTITIAADGATTISTYESETKTRYLQYNSSSPRFACYNSKQKEVFLYKRVGSGHEPVSPDVPAIFVASSLTMPSYNAGDSTQAKLVVKGQNLTSDVRPAVIKTGWRVSPASLTAANVMRSVGDTVTVTYSGSKLKDTADITLSCGELVKTVKAYVSKNVPTVEAVTFTPAAGTYIDSVWVKMSCATAGASIRYTLDGKEPDETSLLFADSIKLTQTVTVKARGFMAEMNDGPVATAKYTIRSSSAPATGDTYNKVYDVAELTNGSKVLIVNEEFNTAASYPNALSGNTYLKYAEVEAGADLMTAEAATEKAENKPYEITIRKHSEGTGFVLYDSIYQRYYTHTKGGKNTVSLDSLEPADYWTIEISDEGVAQLVPSCETNYRMQYNSNSGQERFSCYTGSQKEVALYKREGSGEEPAPVTEPTLTVNRSTLSLSYIKGEEASAEFTVKGRLLTDTVKISVNGTGFSVQPSWIKDSVAMASPVTVTLKYDGSKEIDSAVITVASTGAESVTIKVKAKAIPTYASLEELYEAEVVATQTYVMTGKVVVTNKDSKSNRIWVQDKGMDENFGASILVYQAGNYGYDSLKIGDVITGLTGKLSLYHGLLELTPTEKMRASEHNQNIYVSNLNIPTLKQYAAEYYQSALVRLSDVKFVDAEGNFEGGQSAKNYTLEDASGNRIIFRTDYKDADYLGSAVPTEKFTLTAIVAVYDTTVQITARSLADFDGIPTGIANAKDVRFAVYPNPNTGKFFVTLEEEAVVEVYNAAGVCMMRHRANSGVKEISLKAAGIYFVKVICGERSAVKRVIVR